MKLSCHELQAFFPRPNERWKTSRKRTRAPRPYHTNHATRTMRSKAERLSLMITAAAAVLLLIVSPPGAAAQSLCTTRRSENTVPVAVGRRSDGRATGGLASSASPPPSRSCTPLTTATAEAAAADPGMDAAAVDAVAGCACVYAGLLCRHRPRRRGVVAEEDLLQVREKKP